MILMIDAGAREAVVEMVKISGGSVIGAIGKGSPAVVLTD
jgi:hypothetical protein